MRRKLIDDEINDVEKRKLDLDLDLDFYVINKNKFFLENRN